MDLARRVERICCHEVGERQLRVAVLDQIRSMIPFDAYAWLLTDPVSCVGWSPVAEIPVMDDLPAVIRAKYLTSVNRWTALAPGSARTLVAATAGDCGQSLLWRSVQAAYGIADVASVVLTDRWGCWGFIDLWRRFQVFSDEECGALGEVAELVVPALRRELLATFVQPGPDRADGPALLLFREDLRPVAQTAPTAGYLAALLPNEAGRAVVPAAAMNVAAQLCAMDAGVDTHPAEARVFVPGRSWMTMRCGRLDQREGDGATLAVTIDAATPAERTELYTRVAGLTGREADVVGAIATGRDTRHVARDLGVSGHTVQDHLKSIFAKTRTDSRRQLVARATGTVGP